MADVLDIFKIIEGESKERNKVVKRWVFIAPPTFNAWVGAT